MTHPLPRELRDFARATGYAARPCPTCSSVACAAPARRCANCGGSGRIWHSARGSLDDTGLERLREILSRPDPLFGA